LDSLVDNLIIFTETILTRRREKLKRKEERRKRISKLRDWLEAFLWAIAVVLPVNQYLFQAYAIPSGSMEQTLLIGDRLFVNKFIYGPELLPGFGKLPGWNIPARGDIIIFENPDYESRGPVFDLLQRVVYMATLAQVDLNLIGVSAQDRSSIPPQFLVKRGIALDGDRLRWNRGGWEYRLPGMYQWISEAQVKNMTGLDYESQRLVPDSFYSLMEQATRALARNEAGLEVAIRDQEAYQRLFGESLSGRIPADSFFSRTFEWSHYLSRERNRVDPSHWPAHHVSYETGSYVPQGYILPIGDNRDNSLDGRYFGPVAKDRVLGKAAHIYWPLGRFGGLHP